MEVLTPEQVVLFWLTAGGSGRVLDTVIAVATAESGRRPGAISPDGGYGLFQIQASVWVGALPITRQSLLDPLENARVAVYISRAGANFAAWCTMWADPVRDCGHGQITYPQRGSAAYKYLGLGAGQPTNAPPSSLGVGSSDPTVASEAGWSGIRDWFGGGATKRWTTINNATDRVKRSKQ